MESPGTSSGPARSALTTIVSGIVLVALVWGAYFNSLEGPFTFDDWHVIPENPAVHELASIPDYFTDVTLFSVLEGNRGYRPLFMTSMTLCWWAAEQWPERGGTFPFHVTSVALHTVTVLLLYGVLRRLLRHEARHAGGLSSPSVSGAAFVGAALFAVHPLGTEAVDYVSSQSVLIAACFALLSFYLFLCVYTGRREGGLSWWLRVGAWVAYALALLGKPIAFILPALLLLWDLLLGRRTGLDHPPGGLLRALAGLRKHVPFAAVSGLYLLVRYTVFPGPFGGPDPVRPFFEHALTQTKAIATHYLRLAAFPVGQSVDLDYPISTSWTEPGVLVALVVCVAFLGFLWSVRRHPALVFWSLWFPAGFLITSYGKILRQVTNEHRVYLPLIGFCAVVAILLFKLRDRLPLRVSDLTLGRRTGRVGLAVLVVAILASLGWATHERNRVWSSKLLLWENAARNDGTWRAHMNYALELEAAGRADEALAEFQRAVEIGPYAFAHLNLGLAYVRRNDEERGLWHLRTATELFPDSPDTHLHYGVGLALTGQLDEARVELEKAIQLRPESIRAREELVQLLERQRRLDAAEPYLRFLVDLRPDDAGLRFRLGFALQKLERRAESTEQYEALLRLDPDHTQGTFNLAYAYAKGEGEVEWIRAVELFQRTLVLKPDYHECLIHLAALSRKLGQEAEAIQYEQQHAAATESS